MEVERAATNSSLPGKPPKPFPRNKRHSLQSGESLARFNKLTRHSSQPRLRRDGVSGSLNNLSLESSQRSASLAQLNEQSLAATGKTLSASNLAAVSDSNLSIKEAVLPRSYDQPNSANSYVKRHFELIVKRYFLQLTQGCGFDHCTNKFCSSGELGSKFTPQLAAIVSIELASRNRQYFCVDDTTKPLPAGLFEGDPDEPKPFLYCLFATSPFQSLFEMSAPSNFFPSGSRTNLSQAVSHTNLSRAGSRSTLRGSQSNLNQLALSRPSLRMTSNPDLLSSQMKELADGQDGRIHKKTGSNSSIKDDTKSPMASNSINLDVEFSKVNLSGNLVKEQELTDLPWDLHGSTTSLNELVSLEQFESDLALEMSGCIQEFSLTHLTLEMLQSTIEKYKECNDPSFLINTIRTVFTSVEALNESFRKEENTVNNLQFDELDMDAVRKAYTLLLSLEPRETFVGPLLNATEIHLVTLDSLIITPDEVYQLVILMENPLLHTRQELLRKLCSVLNKLSQETRYALVMILSRYGSQGFNTLIQVFHTFLGKHVHPSQTTEPHLIEICKVMSIFYDAFKLTISELSHPHQDLSVSLFYSDDLSKKVDFKKEYETWQTIKSESDVSENEMSLLDFPFLFDPASKVRVMHIDAVWQMRAEYQNAIVHQARVQQAQRIFDKTEKSNKFNDAIKSATCPFLVLSIRRDYIIKDTLTQIHRKEGDLKKPLKIKYVGGGEQGLDMGGLQKEFFHMIVDSIFESDFGMFSYIEETRCMWINGSSLESEKEFELVGIVLGLAIYNGVILDVHFPSVIYKKLQGYTPNLQDLGSLQPALARSLRELLDFEGDVEDIFCYSFQVSSVDVYGKVNNVDLLPNGSEIPVTNGNRKKFVGLYVKYLLVDSVAKQFDAFSRGFHKVCGGTALTLFNPEELELLICGCPVLDFSQLEIAATYDDGFSPQHPTIKMLWDVFNAMTVKQKKAVLMFVTGSDRVPLKGLSNLTFIIQKHGTDSDRLPSALTCFNRLLLPPYSSEEKLRERLVVAIENSKGFGLT